MYKSNNFDVESLKEKVNELTGFNRARSVKFINLFMPLYNRYEKMLNDKKVIDINDMINVASAHVKAERFNSPYKYIIIDEFQDISHGRYGLLKSFKEQTPLLKFFSVGDDWQSIYRFAGSDTSLFNNFEEYFGYTNTTKIESTYRFGKPLITISGDFAMQNPNQIKKNLSTPLDIKTDISFITNKSFGSDDTESLIKSVSEIIENEIDSNLDIGLTIQESVDILLARKFLILGRYKFDLNRIKFNSIIQLTSSGLIKFNYKGEFELTLSMEFMTVHKSKGLEADYVFILNCNSGKMGFPSEMVDDPVLQLLLGKSEHFHNSEERRLFYVALTRARRRVVCVSNESTKSKFVDEIFQTKSGVSQSCPNCKTGTKKKRQGKSKNGKLWACNYCSNSYSCSTREFPIFPTVFPFRK